eukprot:s9369_g1.t1
MQDMALTGARGGETTAPHLANFPPEPSAQCGDVIGQFSCESVYLKIPADIVLACVRVDAVSFAFHGLFDWTLRASISVREAKALLSSIGVLSTGPEEVQKFLEAVVEQAADDACQF